MNELSLIKSLEEHAFQSSLITSFNVYFPFYERFILKRLQRRGCLFNVLLMDRRQLVKALADPDQAPTLAGKEYLLIPVDCAQSFHPKLLFLFGKKQTRLHVGSHNLTFSGYGHNLEVSSSFTELSDQPIAQQLIGHVQNLAESWMLQSDIPLPIQNALTEFWGQMPQASNLLSDQSPPFYYSTPDGPSLWNQVLADRNLQCSRILVFSPYFDRNLEFLKQLREKFKCPLTVAIDPEVCEVDVDEIDADGVMFVDANNVDLRDTAINCFKHAKFFYFQSTHDEDLLISGSANASAAAWLANTGGRNAEAVVVHEGELAKQLADKLKLNDLFDCPELSATQRAQVRKNNPTADSGSTGGLLWAQREGGELRVLNVPKSWQNGSKLELLDEWDNQLFLISESELVDDRLHFRVEGIPYSSWKRARLSNAESESLQLLLIEVRHIQNLSMSDQEKKIQSLLKGIFLGEDSPQPLFDLFQKLIKSGPQANSASSQSPKQNPVQTASMEIFYQDEISPDSHNHINHLRHGDLGSLLEMLPRLFLTDRKIEPKIQEVDEEELLALTKHEDSDEIDLEPVDTQLREQLSNKATYIVRSLKTNLFKNPDQDIVTVERYAGILACAAHLLSRATLQRSFIDDPKLDIFEQQKELLSVAIQYLFSRSGNWRFKKIVDGNDSLPDELYFLVPALLCLAWEVDVKNREYSGWDTEEIEEAELFDHAVLLSLVPWLNCHPRIEEYLDSVKGNYESEEFGPWLEKIKQWSIEFCTLLPFEKISKKQNIQIGSIVKNRNEEIFVVYRINSETSAHLFQFDDKEIDESTKGKPIKVELAFLKVVGISGWRIWSHNYELSNLRKK
ncbi:MAG: hypothetical protein RRB13_09405 [bacterium]|nr:hypothetical protein [bacterium]